jgi:dTDP-4-dehydrorhamnose reductase
MAVRTLVLGAGGQLGSELVRLVPDAVGLTHADVTVSDAHGVELALREHQPQLVFNCAAFNAVDRAETEQALAHEVNSDGALNVAAACARHGARLVHFSTNFVFDGLLGRPYAESDTAQPISVYGASKLAGEIGVLKALPGGLVIRTAALYGDKGSAIKGGSFPERIVDRARKGEQLRVVSDQRVNPTYARDLAAAAVRLGGGDMSGVLHVAAAGCCSWFEFAALALELCGVDAELEAVATVDLGSPAARPLNGCLESARTDALRPWQEELREWAARRRETAAG